MGTRTNQPKKKDSDKKKERESVPSWVYVVIIIGTLLFLSVFGLFFGSSSGNKAEASPTPLKPFTSESPAGEVAVEPGTLSCGGGFKTITYAPTVQLTVNPGDCFTPVVLRPREANSRFLEDNRNVLDVRFYFKDGTSELYEDLFPTRDVIFPREKVTGFQFRNKSSAPVAVNIYMK